MKRALPTTKDRACRREHTLRRISVAVRCCRTLLTSGVSKIAPGEKTKGGGGQAVSVGDSF